jgi:ubiquinone/menaquinone biosynthesis C-methylase UbiE
MNPHTRIVTDGAPAPVPAAPTNLSAIKARQQATWSAGDFGVVGVTLQIVGETLCEAADLRGGERVLDVACGNGNAALAAARRWCDVTGIDYVPALVEWARQRAAAERLPARFLEGDAEALAFEDSWFDAVISVYGVMFTADHERAARELLRVCRPGGRIAMANWTPGGMLGDIFRVIAAHVPPPPGMPSPLVWGVPERIEELFGAEAAFIRVTPREYVFRYASPRHWIDVFRTFYGPTVKAFAALDEAGRMALERDLVALLERHDRARDGSLVAAAEYLEIVVQKR